MIRTPEEWIKFKSGEFKPETMRLPGVMENHVWGVHSNNPIGFSGYFQMWNFKNRPTYFPITPNAQRYDVMMAARWLDTKRKFLDGDLFVYHLGEEKINWDGRVSQKWDV